MAAYSAPVASRTGARRSASPARRRAAPRPAAGCRGRPPPAARSRRPWRRSAPPSRTAARSTVQPKPLGVLEGVAEAAGIDQQLLRHAAADHAGAAVAVLLGQRRPSRRPRPRPAPRARRPSRRRSRRGRSRSRATRHASWLRISSAMSPGSRAGPVEHLGRAVGAAEHHRARHADEEPVLDHAGHRGQRRRQRRRIADRARGAGRGCGAPRR